MKKLITLLTMAAISVTMTAQTTADDVLSVTRKANNYFMAKYSDPTVPTNVNKIRPSSLWTRAVYYEGLMALYEIDQDQRYIDYTDKTIDNNLNAYAHAATYTFLNERESRSIGEIALRIGFHF